MVHLTEDCQPPLIIIENVKEYDPLVKKYIHQSFGSMDYNVQEFILNHSQFGGNTTRERLFIFCCKGFKVSFEHLGIFPQRKAFDSFLPGRKSIEDCYNITPPTMSKLLDYVQQVEKLGSNQSLSSEWWKKYYGRYTRLDTFSSDKGKGNFESYGIWPQKIMKYMAWKTMMDLGHFRNFVEDPAIAEGWRNLSFSEEKLSHGFAHNYFIATTDRKSKAVIAKQLARQIPFEFSLAYMYVSRRALAKKFPSLVKHDEINFAKLLSDPSPYKDCPVCGSSTNQTINFWCPSCGSAVKDMTMLEGVTST